MGIETVSPTVGDRSKVRHKNNNAYTRPCMQKSPSHGGVRDNGKTCAVCRLTWVQAHTEDATNHGAGSLIWAAGIQVASERAVLLASVLILKGAHGLSGGSFWNVWGTGHQCTLVRKWS